MMALVPFSAWRNKQWPQSRFRTVGKYFQTKGWSVVIFGGPGDREPARRLCDAIGGTCSSVAGEGSLYDLGCLMKQCRLCFGNDTGLTHLARACGVRTGIIYGSTTRHFGFFPYGPPAYRIFETPLWCRPCHAHGGNLCWRISRACLRRIDRQTVITGLEDLCRGDRAREIAGE
jgi:heptosyltransferase-2